MSPFALALARVTTLTDHARRLARAAEIPLTRAGGLLYVRDAEHLAALVTASEGRGAKRDAEEGA